MRWPTNGIVWKKSSTSKIKRYRSKIANFRHFGRILHSKRPGKNCFRKLNFVFISKSIFVRVSKTGVRQRVGLLTALCGEKKDRRQKPKVVH